METMGNGVNRSGFLVIALLLRAPTVEAQAPLTLAQTTVYNLTHAQRTALHLVPVALGSARLLTVEKKP